MLREQPCHQAYPRNSIIEIFLITPTPYANDPILLKHPLNMLIRTFLVFISSMSCRIAHYTMNCEINPCEIVFLDIAAW